MLETVRILDRPVSKVILKEAVAAGFSDLQSRVIAGRLTDADSGNLRALLRPQLGELTSPYRLPDIDAAAEAVAEAIVEGRPIIPLSDYDCDGASAHAVLKIALTHYFGVPDNQIHSFIGHRVRDGYGVSDNLTDRIIEQAPRSSLIITADQGSSDHARIERLLDYGIQTIVTDHHTVPAGGPPPAAIACVNPVRQDSLFPDPYIAGVHVAWLLCCAVRQSLIKLNHISEDTPRLGGLLDFVALGTMADCVDLGRSPNNRAVLQAGLALMNSPNPRPVWKALYAATKCSGPITAATIGYSFGPVINARGRLDCALGSIDLLLSTEGVEADRMAAQLVEHNTERKKIQTDMLNRSIPQAEQQVRSGSAAITVFDPDGHSGVHGICAARLVELFGRPVAYFSPKYGAESVTGSIRSVPGFHVQKALEEFASNFPGEALAYGGHSGAGGIHLRYTALLRFGDTFSSIAARDLSADSRGPHVFTDGELSMSPSLDVFRELSQLEPFGRQWEAPLFRGKARILQVRPVGDGSHLKLSVEMSTGCFEAIWFGVVKNGKSPVEEGQTVIMAYELDSNTFRNATRLQLRIRQALPMTLGGS